ncbi:class I SAM-dependent methyltransferase [Brevibacillus fluminis]|uniref:Class I SAM-dependent methyltransferase n=1 Tax=Brevibacillus fluminis TaxID=511487 RepID=A0A3M8DJE5_9BACL|nr:class I SAM-dependent methyltransferase [Brevibacillus fluminis]RNB87247.1 class I SAM-dependent methyltransferase [Brevibacillus fluminis]
MQMNGDVKKTVKEQFGQHAEKYVVSETHAKADDLQELVTWLDPRPNWRFLDIATGGGHVTKAVSPHVALVFATDLTRPMLAAAKRHLDAHCENVHYLVADAEDLPFLDESFDAVASRIAPHHFPNPEAFVREVNRVLKPGGKFLLIDNIAPEDEALDRFVNTLEKLRDKSHVRSYSIREWRAWIESTSLEEQRSATRKKTFTYATWVRRTTESEEEVRRVTDHVTGADEAVRAYFAVKQEGDEIVSLAVDEWMALFEKKAAIR